MVVSVHGEENIKSLEQLFRSFSSQGSRDEILNNLARYEKAVQTYKHDTHLCAVIKWHQSRFLQKAGHYPRAEQLLDEILTIIEPVDDTCFIRWKLKTYISLGYVHKAQRNYQDVEFYLHQALSIAREEPGFLRYRRKICSLLGRVYLTLQKFSQAKTFIEAEKEAAYEEYMQELSDDLSPVAVHYAYALINWVRIRRIVGLADHHLEQPIKNAVSFFETYDHEKGRLRAFFEEAALQCALKQHEIALEQAHTLEKQFLSMHMYGDAMKAMLLSVHVYRALLEYGRAERTLNELITLAKKHDLGENPTTAEAFYELGALHYDTNREQEALEYFRHCAKLGMVLGINQLVIRAFNAARLVDKTRAEELLNVDLVYQDALFVKSRFAQQENHFAGFKTKVRLFASTLFVHITGFSHLIRRANYEEAIKMIDECVDRLCLIIYQHRGYIDTFHGDGLMAIFEHGHETNSDAAFHAVAAGFDIQRALHHKNRKLRTAYGAGNDITVRTGVSTGEIYAIILGSYIRRAFAYLGNSVSLVSSCEHPDTGVMTIDQDTYSLVHERVIAQPAEVILPLQGPATIFRISRLARMKPRPNAS